MVAVGEGKISGKGVGGEYGGNIYIRMHGNGK
jgi:hypothetical protein